MHVTFYNSEIIDSNKTLSFSFTFKMCQIVFLSYVRHPWVQVNKKTFCKAYTKAILDLAFLYIVIHILFCGSRNMRGKTLCMWPYSKTVHENMNTALRTLSELHPHGKVLGLISPFASWRLPLVGCLFVCMLCVCAVDIVLMYGYINTCNDPIYVYFFTYQLLDPKF